MSFEQNDYLFITVSSAMIFWTGGFVLFYGIQAFQNASFPLFFLIFKWWHSFLYADSNNTDSYPLVIEEV